MEERLDNVENIIIKSKTKDEIFIGHTGFVPIAPWSSIIADQKINFNLFRIHSLNIAYE